MPYMVLVWDTRRNIWWSCRESNPVTQILQGSAADPQTSPVVLPVDYDTTTFWM